MKSNKWVVLGCFSAAAGLSQFLWLNFAPILSLIQKRFSISESQASLLLLVFPLIYVFLSIHAGAMTDKKGYRASLLFGTALMAVFSALRIYFESFWLLFVAQVGIAIAQPYVVNAVSKLVLDWFGKDQEAMATGLGTMGMFIGMSLGMAATPPLVESIGIERTMALFCAVSVIVFLACLRWVIPNPAKNQTIELTTQSFWADSKVLFKNGDLVAIFMISFLGLGYFNGLTTWLEPILAPRGMNSVQAGIVGGVLIFGGIFGAAIIPALSDKTKKRKPFLILCVAVGLIALYPFTMSSNYSFVLILAAIQGFFFLPAYALLLEMASELSGPKLAGSATGILMLTGNAGAVIVIVAMEAIKGDQPTFDRSILLLLGLLALALVFSLKIRETFHKR